MARKMVSIMAAAVCGLYFSATLAEAELISIGIEGRVTDVRGDLDLIVGKIKVGDIITGTYTYDSSMSDSQPEGYWGAYEYKTPPNGISLAIDEFLFRTDPENVDFCITIYNNPPTAVLFDQILVTSYSNLPLSNGVVPRLIQIGFFNRGRGPLSSDALPVTAPVLSVWEDEAVYLSVGPGVRGAVVEADITSAILIPEPATLLLLGLGGLALLKKRRFAKREQRDG